MNTNKRYSVKLTPDQVLERLGERIGGRYDHGYGSPRMRKSHGPWIIVCDAMYGSENVDGHGFFYRTVLRLRVRALYISRDYLTFKVCHRTLLSIFGIPFSHLFIMKRVKTGSPNFDRNFILKGTPLDKTAQLFKPSQLIQIGEIAANQPYFFFEGKKASYFDAFGPDVKMLQYQATNRYRKDFEDQDIDRLVTACDLFAMVLDQLVVIGSAERKSTKWLFD